MEWYWWVLIGIGVFALGFVKFYFWGKIMKKRQNKDTVKHEDED